MEPMRNGEGRSAGYNSVEEREIGGQLHRLKRRRRWEIERADRAEYLWIRRVSIGLRAVWIHNRHVHIHFGPVAVVGPGRAMRGRDHGKDSAGITERSLHGLRSIVKLLASTCDSRG